MAAEATGGSGAVGHDFPQGVQGLATVVLDATRYELTWEPVQHDIDGEFTPVARYDVFASQAGPLTRQDVESLVPAATSILPTVVIDQSLGSWHFVVAEDVHGNRSAW